MFKQNGVKINLFFSFKAKLHPFTLILNYSFESRNLVCKMSPHQTAKGPYEKGSRPTNYKQKL